jgi:hypothetical protein
MRGLRVWVLDAQEGGRSLVLGGCVSPGLAECARDLVCVPPFARRFDKTVDQLGAYLSYLLGQGKVVCENSVYRRAAAPPPPTEN